MLLNYFCRQINHLCGRRLGGLGVLIGDAENLPPNARLLLTPHLDRYRHIVEPLALNIDQLRARTPAEFAKKSPQSELCVRFRNR